MCVYPRGTKHRQTTSIMCAHTIAQPCRCARQHHDSNNNATIMPPSTTSDNIMALLSPADVHANTMTATTTCCYKAKRPCTFHLGTNILDPSSMLLIWGSCHASKLCLCCSHNTATLPVGEETVMPTGVHAHMRAHTHIRTHSHINTNTQTDQMHPAPTIAVILRGPPAPPDALAVPLLVPTAAACATAVAAAGPCGSASGVRKLVDVARRAYSHFHKMYFCSAEPAHTHGCLWQLRGTMAVATPGCLPPVLPMVMATMTQHLAVSMAVTAYKRCAMSGVPAATAAAASVALAAAPAAGVAVGVGVSAGAATAGATVAAVAAVAAAVTAWGAAARRLGEAMRV
eukprot:1160291-Pelagomonas_calceolata.AAC.6